MAGLVVKLLGSFRLTLDGRAIDSIESDKARALLAYLVVENGRAHSREKLIGLLWPEQDEAHARGSLSQALYHLRGILGDRPITGILPNQTKTHPRPPYLLVSAQEIRFNPGCDYELDESEFNALVKSCKAHAHPATSLCEDCFVRYQEAAQLYRGDFLDGFYLPKNLAFEEWITLQREQLRIEMLQVLNQLVWSFERWNDIEQALVYARRMAQLDELSEASAHHVMRLLAMLGRKGEAIAHYDAFRQTLAIQLGSEPGIETKHLHQRLCKEKAGEVLGRLPSSLIPFIGRKQELSILWEWFCDPERRLICILGAGGSGKTRLAIEAARRQMYSFSDGVYFVPLSALVPGSSLLASIAESLGFTFRETGDPKRQLVDWLRCKKALIILDSFETVVESAGLVAELLAASPGSKALVTSRERLNLSGEQVYLLTGMKVPPSETQTECLNYSSVELFLNSARRVNPDYTPQDLEQVGRICRLVNGMPLGLLLASTWVSEYSDREIADQIERNLDFLSADWADLPKRQRSLRATFEYSWNLLKAAEQDIVMKLSVFRNPFDGLAAHQVANASIHLLHALVGTNLLSASSDGYYQMHDLVRQFSSEKLMVAPSGQEITIRQRHCDYFLKQAEEWGIAFKSSRQSAALIKAGKVVEDVHAAMLWATGHADAKKLLPAMEGLLLYYFLRYRFEEGEHACQLAGEGLEIVQENRECQHLMGYLLAWRAHYCRLMGRVESARRFADESMDVLMRASASGEDVRRAQSLLRRERGFLASNLSDQFELFLQSAELFSQVEDHWWQAAVLSWAGELANRSGDRARSYSLLQQAVSLSREAGEPRRLAYSLRLLAYYLLIFGPWESGKSLMEDAARWDRSAGDLGGLASADLHLGTALGWIGHYSEACNIIESAIEKFQQLGDHFYTTYGTLALAIGQMHSGRYGQALNTLEGALGMARQGAFRREEAYGLAQRACFELVNGKLAQAIADSQLSVASFRQMGFAGELSMALSALALAQHQADLDKPAFESLQEALRISVDSHSRFSLFTLAASLVIILADSNRPALAAEAYTAVMKDPIVANSRWFADMVGDRIDHARQHLPKDVIVEAEGRARKGDVFEVLGELIKAIEPQDSKESDELVPSN